MDRLIIERITDNTPRVHKFFRLLFFLSMFSWTTTNIEDYAAGGGIIEKIFTRILPLALVCIYAILSPQRKNILNILQKHNLNLLWYIAFGVICGMFSKIPALCLWKGFEIFTILIWMSISCYDENSTKREFLAFVKLIEFLLYATLILAIINPAKGLWQAGRPLPWITGYLPTMNPNQIGIISTIVFITLMFTKNKWKPLRLALIGICILFAQSRTSYAITSLVFLLFAYSAFQKRDRKGIAICVTFGILGAGLSLGMMDLVLNIITRGQTVEEIGTLSGRTTIWSIASEKISIFGGGFATASRSLIDTHPDSFHGNAVNLHNSYLEAILSAGLLGALPYLCLIPWYAIKAFIAVPTKKQSYDIVLASLALLFLARGMTSIALSLFTVDMLMLNLLMKLCYIRNIKHRIPFEKPQPKPRTQPSRQFIHNQTAGKFE